MLAALLVAVKRHANPLLHVAAFGTLEPEEGPSHRGRNLEPPLRGELEKRLVSWGPGSLLNYDEVTICQREITPRVRASADGVETDGRAILLFTIHQITSAELQVGSWFVDRDELKARVRCYSSSVPIEAVYTVRRIDGEWQVARIEPWGSNFGALANFLLCAAVVAVGFTVILARREQGQRGRRRRREGNYRRQLFRLWWLSYLIWACLWGWIRFVPRSELDGEGLRALRVVKPLLSDLNTLVWIVFFFVLLNGAKFTGARLRRLVLHLSGLTLGGFTVLYGLFYSATGSFDLANNIHGMASICAAVMSLLAVGWVFVSRFGRRSVMTLLIIYALMQPLGYASEIVHQSNLALAAHLQQMAPVIGLTLALLKAVLYLFVLHAIQSSAMKHMGSVGLHWRVSARVHSSEPFAVECRRMARETGRHFVTVVLTGIVTIIGLCIYYRDAVLEFSIGISVVVGAFSAIFWVLKFVPIEERR